MAASTHMSIKVVDQEYTSYCVYRMLSQTRCRAYKDKFYDQTLVCLGSSARNRNFPTHLRGICLRNCFLSTAIALYRYTHLSFELYEPCTASFELNLQNETLFADPFANNIIANIVAQSILRNSRK